MTSEPSRLRRFTEKLLDQTALLLKRPQPAVHVGVGATPHEKGGTTFRVWAPHAQQVWVTGTFNRWARRTNPLAAEGDGYWSGTIAAAQVGHEYKYLIQNGRHTLARTDPRARAVTVGPRNSVICDTHFDWAQPAGTAEYRTPGWHELIIYELHVGTFGVQDGHKIGTFQGVADRLPYLQALGINAIELMPIMAFDGEYSWGYNPAHPFAVTDVYGGRNALKALVKAAHAHGIAVILDVVYNHFGPQDLHLWQFDGWHEDNKGGIYFYNDWRSNTPWGDTRPDYGRPEVRQFIAENALLWLEEFRMDGLRWDATNYIRNAHGGDGDPGADIPEGWEVLRQVNDVIDSHVPWKINIAEDLQNNLWLTKPTAEGGAGFDAQWEAEFVHPIRQAIITPQDEARDMAAVAAAIAHRPNDNAFQRVIFTESHDEVANGKARVPEEITPTDAESFFAQKRSTLGAALVFTSPGIPMIFQGQEFLADRWFTDQEPLDWARAERLKGIVALYRDLMALRRNEHGRTAGLRGQFVNVFHVNNEDKLIAFHRWQEGGRGDDVVVVANFANRIHEAYTIGLPHAGQWQVRFNSDDTAYSPAFSGHLCPAVLAAAAGQHPFDNMPSFGNLTMGPYSVVVLSQGG